DDLEWGTIRDRECRASGWCGESRGSERGLAFAQPGKWRIGAALEPALRDEHGFAVPEQDDRRLEAGRDVEAFGGAAALAQ
ncbi:MAG TPA: hypothetical protein VK656_07025, partial [Candidatus Acidoferrum sp.]|nr:hypothetical protein [Candidatus Acidoferrum sp.]